MLRKEKEEKKPKTKLQKILDVIVTVIIVFVVILAIVVLFVTITAKKSPDGAMNVFGYQMRTILTGSMEDCGKHKDGVECEFNDVSGYSIGHLPVESMIFIELVPESKSEAEKWYSKIKKGDVLTFQYSGMGVVTHRVYSVEALQTGGYKIELRGDNCGGDGEVDSQIIDTSRTGNYNKIIGKVTGQSLFLGKTITFIQQPYGAIVIIFIPCFMIVIVELVRIISILKQSKKEKEAEKEEGLKKENDSVRNDIEELKKQIALAQQSMGITTTVDQDSKKQNLDENATESEKSENQPKEQDESEEVCKEDDVTDKTLASEEK